jgi:hypothetical protein
VPRAHARHVRAGFAAHVLGGRVASPSLRPDREHGVVAEEVIVHHVILANSLPGRSSLHLILSLLGKVEQAVFGGVARLVRGRSEVALVRAVGMVIVQGRETYRLAGAIVTEAHAVPTEVDVLTVGRRARFELPLDVPPVVAAVGGERPKQPVLALHVLAQRRQAAIQVRCYFVAGLLKRAPFHHQARGTAPRVLCRRLSEDGVPKLVGVLCRIEPLERSRGAHRWTKATSCCLQVARSRSGVPRCTLQARRCQHERWQRPTSSTHCEG